MTPASSYTSLYDELAVATSLQGLARVELLKKIEGESGDGIPFFSISNSTSE